MARGIYGQDPIYDQNTIDDIKQGIPEISNLHDSVIEMLWSDFSDTWYCASYLDCNMSEIETFKVYLFSEKTDLM